MPKTMLRKRRRRRKLIEQESDALGCTLDQKHYSHTEGSHNTPGTVQDIVSNTQMMGEKVLCCFVLLIPFLFLVQICLACLEAVEASGPVVAGFSVSVVVSLLGLIQRVLGLGNSVLRRLRLGFRGMD